MKKRWLIKRTNAEYIEYLSKSASISPVLAQILINRGIKTPQEVCYFLNPDISQLSDPFDIPGMKTAVDRIMDAHKRSERVFVHGDYDADGLSATAILIKTLKMLGIDCYYFIPNRMLDGYGFNPPAVKKAKDIGAKLIITADCGITSFEAVTLARKEGIDVIITDHHEPSPSKVESDAIAIINPKLFSPRSPTFNLSGAGVAFKLAQALALTNGLEIYDLCDLAAVGTISDIVPITGENRLIVKEGLKLISNGSRHGLNALKEVSGVNKREIKAGLLAFTIIPRINAAGRLSDSNAVVKLLLAGPEDEAINISLWLDELNSKRQEIEEKIYQDALSKLNKDIRPAIVLSSEGWHQGVIGIVASRIAELFYRPTFIISIEGQLGRGSARSIPPFDIHKGLADCREFLISFGGHRQAAGFKLESKYISAFEEKINTIVSETLTDDDFIPTIEIDADVNLSNIDFNLVRELEKLEPIGYGNPEPLLGSKRLEVLYPRIVGNHLKMKLRQKSYTIEAIGFDMARFSDILEVSTMVDAVFTPFINEWEGGKCLELNLKAFRPST